MRVVQVRQSPSISLMRSHSVPGVRVSGRRGIRTPSKPSTNRPSASDSTRVKPMNSRKNGTPMMRMARPNDSDRPTAAVVK